MRAFAIEDADRVMALAGNRKVYETTLNIPHPYEEGMAESWIAGHLPRFYAGRGIDLAVTLKESGEVVGAIGLAIDPRHWRAELGYWMGVPYWGRGYCTEAAKAMARHAFEEAGCHKVTSRHMETNPASGRVMQKIGLQKEGVLQDEVFKDGLFHTLVVYGLVRADE